MKRETVLIISDLQCPFQHKDAFNFLEEVAQKYQPTSIVCIGDELDFHKLSDFDSDPDGLSAGDELRKAIDNLGPLFNLFPKVKSCISNHTLRPFRRAFKYGIPRALMRSYREFLEAPRGWTWENYYIIDEVRYEHGHELGGGYGKMATANAAIKNGRSTVFGHFHANAGIHYTSTPEALLFGFNVGCLIDFKSYAFAYAQGSKSRPILGCGIVSERIPTFVPMLKGKSGRWVKRLVG